MGRHRGVPWTGAVSSVIAGTAGRSRIHGSQGVELLVPEPLLRTFSCPWGLFISVSLWDAGFVLEGPS